MVVAQTNTPGYEHTQGLQLCLANMVPTGSSLRFWSEVLKKKQGAAEGSILLPPMVTISRLIGRAVRRSDRPFLPTSPECDRSIPPSHG